MRNHLSRRFPRFDLVSIRVDPVAVLSLLIFIDLYHDGRDSDVFEDMTRIRTFLFELLFLKLV